MINSIEVGRKEDGNRSIADKIIKRLHDLEKTVENNHGRWAWELLQNAKDSIADEDRTVDVTLVVTDDFAYFAHNGTHFTENDVRGLINQISSKEVEEGVKSTKTGRFGTGFITTHLLSKLIHVSGVVKTQDEQFYKFNFPLDREGATTSILAPKIEATWVHFQNKVERIFNFDKQAMNTTFMYRLNSDKQKNIAQKGIEEFIRLMPYVLAFNPKIGRVSINNKNYSVIFERKTELLHDFIVQISKKEGNVENLLQIAKYGNSDGSISVAAEIDAATHSVKPFTNVPRLFCDFPLVGTEVFYFPVVVNSFLFNPHTERHSVWLKGSDDDEVIMNQKILEAAVGFFHTLLSKLADLDIKNLYNVADTRIPQINKEHFDVEWYKTKIQKDLILFILNVPIVNTHKHGKQRLSQTFIPSDRNKTNEILWSFANDFIAEPVMLPEYQSLNFWSEVISEDGIDDKFDKRLTRTTIAKIITEKEDTITLRILLGKKDLGETFDWLNRFYEYVQDMPDLFNQNEIVPNQYGRFAKVNRKDQYNSLPHLFNDAINDENLLDISEIFGKNYRRNLIHQSVTVHLTNAQFTKLECATFINNQLKDKKDYTATELQGLLALMQWFENNPEEGRNLFPDLYRKRAELFMKTIEDKDSLYQIMKSKTPLSTLSEIAIAIENDPEIVSLIQRRTREIKEEQERNEIGEAVEAVLAETLQDFGFSVQKVHVGRDLVISLKNSSIHYDIEVKSTNSDGYVALTSTQAETAVSKPNNYALCVVRKDGSVITKEYIKQNAKFITNIGHLLVGKVQQMTNFSQNQNAIIAFNEDINLSFENALEYKYKISPNIWKNGKAFSTFVSEINGL